MREKHGIHIGLHTSSAVNVAEFAPYASKGVDEYLKAYIDIYPKVGAEWIVVHAGYHFGKDKPVRMKAGLERLKRMADYAEKKKVRLLLENLNKEPEDAEVHYLAHTLEEWRYYWGCSTHPRCGSHSPSTTRISCPKATKASPMRSISVLSAKCVSPTATATATKCT